ncbi:hypothetical protein JZ751_015436 [Albula glossodonta]|uniref:Uncharacterized protein n=1 Tax=Albula glossodonta TaxID=121402 RepID=A0A8T2MVY7_9TELE|nr:hypothetical protein JZ751_015436 [Albula glossodonta]
MNVMNGQVEETKQKAEGTQEKKQREIKSKQQKKTGRERGGNGHSTAVRQTCSATCPCSAPQSRQRKYRVSSSPLCPSPVLPLVAQVLPASLAERLGLSAERRTEI